MLAQDTHLAFNRFEGVFNSVTAYCLSKANFENTKSVMQQPIITQDNKMAISLARRAAHIPAMTFQTGLPIALLFLLYCFWQKI